MMSANLVLLSKVTHQHLSTCLHLATTCQSAIIIIIDLNKKYIKRMSVIYSNLKRQKIIIISSSMN
jgi:hypothetical protein